MVRPRRRRRLRFKPLADYFKPAGIPLRQLREVNLRPDEIEAIKLYYNDGLSQKNAALQMNISQPTFARTIKSACQKISRALTQGLAIRIEKKP